MNKLSETLNFLKSKGSKGKKQPEPGKKKRGQYKERECPYCHAHVRNLGNHIKLKHPTEAPAPVELTKEQLLGTAPAMAKAEKITYYCQNCHAEIRKGETECWNCGANLIWEGIE